MTAPLPPQFRQTALSFPSIATAFGSELVFINAILEHKQVRHKRRELSCRDSCQEVNQYCHENTP